MTFLLGNLRPPGWKVLVRKSPILESGIDRVMMMMLIGNVDDATRSLKYIL